MSKKKSRKPMSTEEPSGGLGAFGALLSAKGLKASEEAAAPAAADPSPDEDAGSLDWSSLKRLDVQRTSKGRKGKTVTLVKGFPASGKALKPLAKELGRALGVGVSVEEDALVVQGDQRDRLQNWLEYKGVGRVVLTGG